MAPGDEVLSPCASSDPKSDYRTLSFLQAHNVVARSPQQRQGVLWTFASQGHPPAINWPVSTLRRRDYGRVTLRSKSCGHLYCLVAAQGIVPSAACPASAGAILGATT